MGYSSGRKYYKSYNHQGKNHIPVGPPIAPAIISRGELFEPRLKNLVGGTRESENAWVSVRVTGRIGAIHRKVLDSIFAENLGERDVGTGGKEIVIAPYTICVLAKVARNPQWLLGILDDMRQVTIEITDKNSGLRHWGSIINEVWEVKTRAKMPNANLGFADRKLYCVQISAAWMRIFDTSLVVRYKSALRDLHTIENGAAYMLALHILTHGKGYFDVEHVLEAIGATQGISARAVEKTIRAVVAEEEGEGEKRGEKKLRLSKLGMKLYKDPNSSRLMICYNPRSDVRFQLPPAQNAPEAV